jgi:membrane protein DedA with SNARE-associated domain
MSFVTVITDLVSMHPHLAYGAVFLLALSEAIPIVGALVPGSALIIGISALVPAGFVELVPLLIAATMGAITGDGLSYGLGHRYHREVLCRWPLNRYPELVARSEAFLNHHGGKSVFLARFTPGGMPLRITRRTPQRTAQRTAITAATSVASRPTFCRASSSAPPSR